MSTGPNHAAKTFEKFLVIAVGVELGLVGVRGFLGVAVGMVTSKDVAVIGSQPGFALPDPRFLSYRFEPSLMMPFTIAASAAGLRAIGVITTARGLTTHPGGGLTWTVFAPGSSRTASPVFPAVAWRRRA
jgi:hypothetical protein